MSASEAAMRRRDFITLMGSAAMWPAAAIAQQDKRLVGIITGFNDKEMAPLYAAFRARLRELGWIEGQNVVFDVRATSGDYGKLDTEVSSLIAASVDVIVALGTAGLAAAKRYTKTIPVVFTQFRSRWSAIDRQPGPSGRQRHRPHQFRIR